MKTPGKPLKTSENPGKFRIWCFIGKPRNLKKRTEKTILITFYAFLRVFNLFLLLTNKNYAKIT